MSPSENLGAIRSQLAKAAKQSEHFSEAQLICISGIETGATWNPGSHRIGSSRYGLFQWDERNWEEWMKVLPKEQRVGWSVANAFDVATSALLAVASLEARFRMYSRTLDYDSSILAALSGFGEGDVYGRAVLKCEEALAQSLQAAVAVINAYNQWVSGGRKGTNPF